MNNESRPSAENIPKPKAVRIETETSVVSGHLLAKEDDLITVAVLGDERESTASTHLLRYNQNTLGTNRPFVFEYSFDGGESWKTKTSDSPLKSIKAWERADRTTSLDDLIARTVSKESGAEIDDSLYSQYPEYQFVAEAMRYTQEHPEDAKTTAGFDTNTGWKIHFTPSPEFVPEISSYLKENGYSHKYLCGGLPSEGKAFTVYIGSRQLMEKWVAELEYQLSDKLFSAIAENEEAVTPHISARFTSVEEDSFGEKLFHQYGVHGMSALHTTMKKRFGEDKNFTPLDDSEVQEIALEAYDALSRRYGSYFHG